MTNVLIRDVPDDVHVRLQARAEALGLSLQRYLVQALADVANRGDIASAVSEWEQRARSSSRVDTVWAVDDIHAARDARAAAVDGVVNVTGS